MRPILAMLLRGYTVACLAFLAISITLRAAYYSVPDLPQSVRDGTATFMRKSLASFLGQTNVPLVSAAVVAALLLLLAFARKLVFAREPGSPLWPLRAWAVAVAANLLAANDYAVDADPYVTKLWTFTLALLAVALFGKAPSPKRQRVIAAMLAVTCFGAFDNAPSGAVAIAVTVWAAALAVFGYAARRRIPRSDALLYLLVMTPVCSLLLPAGLGLVAPGLRKDHPETVETQGYAYGYCEVPELHKLFMTIPVGETGDLARLRSGFVAEYDTQTGARREHHLFSDSFFGGLRMIYCMRDAVQITMNMASIDSFVSVANVMEFDPTDPQRMKPTIFEDEIRRQRGWDLLGHAAVYDDEHDAMFYVSEWTNTLYRLDRKTGVLDTEVGRILPPKPFVAGVNFGPQTGAKAIHRGRDTIYLSEWADGSDIYEISTTSLEVVRMFDTEDTGSFGLAVDEAADRLYASGLWGVNVFDLSDGHLIARMRTGPGARAAVIDDRRQIVYIPTTFSGHMWAYDRGTLAPLGRVLTGLGGRPGYITLDGRHLYASDQRGVYRWDADALAKRLRSQ